MNIVALHGEEPPVLGLFYLLQEGLAADRPRRWGIDAPANGMAFLVTGDGILATAAHALWMMGLRPGDVVPVFGADPTLPVQGLATILETGWRGPLPNQDGQVHHPDFESEIEGRRDVLVEDCALLKLKEASLRFDPVRGGEAPDRRTLLARLRYLPIGVPGYPPATAVQLTAWQVTSLNGSSQALTTQATFVSHEPSLHHALQLHAPAILPGFSGSPVWDDARRLCIGLVRSGISTRLDGRCLATDARALAKYGRIPLAYDAQLGKVIAAATAMLEHFASGRHAGIVQGAGHDQFVEPNARPVFNGAALDERDLAAAPVPALSLIVRELEHAKLLFIQSGAGSGKSTVLRTLTRRMLENQHLLGMARPLLPILLDAAQLDPTRFSVAAFVQTALEHTQAGLLLEQGLEHALDLNDAELIFLIDSLDEIDAQHVGRLLSVCVALLKPGSRVARVIVATRPLPQSIQRDNGRTYIPSVEILPFDHSKVERFAAQRFTSTTERDAYLDALSRIEWMRDASPLQLEMAATVFNQPAGIPARAADLVFDYIDIRLSATNMSTSAATDQPPLSSPTVYEVIKVLAAANLHGGPLDMEKIEAALAERFGASADGDWQVLVAQAAARCAGLFHLKPTRDGPQLHWEHRTIMEALAAEDAVASTGGQAMALQKLLPRVDSRHDHRFQLALLCVMERRGWSDVVEARLERAMAAPVSAQNEALLALRALAAGITTSVLLRRKLVALLVRAAMTPRIDAIRCAEVYSSATDLPNVLAIIARPELREDIADTLWNYFKWRNPRRRGIDRPLVVTGPAAKLLDILHMWNYWREDGLELAKPDVDPSEAPRPAQAAPRGAGMRQRPGMPNVVDQGTFSVVDRDGLARTYEIPARMFLEGVAAMAQRLPRQVSPALVVHLYLRGIGSDPVPPGAREN